MNMMRQKAQIEALEFEVRRMEAEERIAELKAKRLARELESKHNN